MNPLSIATGGYLTGRGIDPIAIATEGYICTYIIVYPPIIIIPETPQQISEEYYGETLGLNKKDYIKKTHFNDDDDIMQIMAIFIPIVSNLSNKHYQQRLG